MRLLRTHSARLELKDFLGDPPARYAIVSHTWGRDEVEFADVDSPGVSNKAGFRKIAYAINQARADGLEYLWMDTCCINKASSAELSEAINSMYYWYQQAAVCYAYLSDIEGPNDDFCGSRWFTRGWTLQELLAPRQIVFYTCHWRHIGTKASLCQSISTVTKIPLDILSGSAPCDSASVSRRMSWVSTRKTTRVEDMAYCLLGLFGVNMPLLYGERHQAFVRLQEEIIKVTDDQTLFAWIDPDAGWADERGMLAEHPRFFQHSAGFVPCTDPESREPHSMINRRLKIEVRSTHRAVGSLGKILLAHLSCCDAKSGQHTFAVQLKPTSSARNEYRRIMCNQAKTGMFVGDLISVTIPQTVLTSSFHKRCEVHLAPDQLIIFRNLHNESKFKVQLVSCATRFTPDEELTLKVLGSMGDILQSSRQWMPPSMPPFCIGQRIPDRIAFAMRFDLSWPNHHGGAQMVLAIGMAKCKTLGVWIDKSTATNITIDAVQTSETQLRAGKESLTDISIHLSSTNLEKRDTCYMSLEVEHVVKYPGDCHIVDWRFHNEKSGPGRELETVRRTSV